MVPEIDLSAFAAARADGAVVIDVRERHEYAGGHVPGARPVPLALVDTRARELPRNRPVFVICESGNRSAQAVGRLRREGVDAISVAGGTSAWAAQGRPLVSGPHATSVAV